MREDLFSLEINNEGIYWLEKLRKVGRIILIATIVITVMSLYKNTPLLIELSNTSSQVELRWKVMNKLYLISFFADIALCLFAATNYYRFTEALKKGILEKNNMLLNQSFRFIYWIIIAFILELCIMFVSLSYSFVAKAL